MANKKALQLNDRKIKTLEKPESKKWVRDGGGLALCLTPAQKGDWRHWYFIYTSPETGKKCYKPLGSYPGLGLADARNEAAVLTGKLLNGIDPMAEERRAQEAKVRADEAARLEREAAEKILTVESLVSEYIERHAKRFKMKSWEEDKSILYRDVVPAWGRQKASAITKRDVVQVLEKIINRGSPGMANNTFKIIRKMFNWAVEQDILPLSPCAGLKLPSPKLSRERVLSEPEIRTLWDNLNQSDMRISHEVQNALKLILITAQRPGEVIGMHTNEIDRSWWTIPSERSKNGKTHRIHLTNLAQEIIEESLCQVKESLEIPEDQEYIGYIFPTPIKNRKSSINRHAMSRSIMRNLSVVQTDKDGNKLFTANGNPVTENRLGIDHFTPHDLRRTAATFMAKAGEMDEVIDAVLNHSKQGVIKVYNQYRYDIEKQKALETWERKLTAILTGKKDNVVSIKRNVA